MTEPERETSCTCWEKGAYFILPDFLGEWLAYSRAGFEDQWIAI